jgi:hypothetical protein
VLGMPPAFVLSQNQTLKLMTDKHPGGMTEEQASISRSRSCTNTQMDVYEDNMERHIATVRPGP